MIEPIQYGGDGYEGGGVGGEILISRGGAAVDFDPTYASGGRPHGRRLIVTISKYGSSPFGGPNGDVF